MQFMHDPLNRLCLLGRDREMIRPKARNMFDKGKIEINCITFYHSRFKKGTKWNTHKYTMYINYHVKIY